MDGFVAGCMHELNPSGCMYRFALVGDFVGGCMYGLALVGDFVGGRNYGLALVGDFVPQ